VKVTAAKTKMTSTSTFCRTSNEPSVLRFEEHLIAEITRLGNADARRRNVRTKLAAVHQVLDPDVPENSDVGAADDDSATKLRERLLAEALLLLEY
jgi:hypothetical protein